MHGRRFSHGSDPLGSSQVNDVGTGLGMTTTSIPTSHPTSPTPTPTLDGMSMTGVVAMSESKGSSDLLMIQSQPHERSTAHDIGHTVANSKNTGNTRGLNHSAEPSLMHNDTGHPVDGCTDNDAEDSNEASDQTGDWHLVHQFYVAPSVPHPKRISLTPSHSGTFDWIPQSTPTTGSTTLRPFGRNTRVGSVDSTESLRGFSTMQICTRTCDEPDEAKDRLPLSQPDPNVSEEHHEVSFRQPPGGIPPLSLNLIHTPSSATGGHTSLASATPGPSSATAYGAASGVGGPMLNNQGLASGGSESARGSIRVLRPRRDLKRRDSDAALLDIQESHVAARAPTAFTADWSRNRLNDVQGGADPIERPSSAMSVASSGSSNHPAPSTISIALHSRTTVTRGNMAPPPPRNNISSSTTPVHLKHANRESPSVQASIILSRLEVSSPRVPDLIASASCNLDEHAVLVRTNANGSTSEQRVGSPSSQASQISTRIRKAVILEPAEYIQTTVSPSPILNTIPSPTQQAVTSNASVGTTMNATGSRFIVRSQETEFSTRRNLHSRSSVNGPSPSPVYGSSRTTDTPPHLQPKHVQNAANVLEQALASASQSALSAKQASSRESLYQPCHVTISPTASPTNRSPLRPTAGGFASCNGSPVRDTLLVSEPAKTSVAVGIKAVEPTEANDARDNLESLIPTSRECDHVSSDVPELSTRKFRDIDCSGCKTGDQPSPAPAFSSPVLGARQLPRLTSPSTGTRKPSPTSTPLVRVYSLTKPQSSERPRRNVQTSSSGCSNADCLQRVESNAPDLHNHDQMSDFLPVSEGLTYGYTNTMSSRPSENVYDHAVTGEISPTQILDDSYTQSSLTQSTSQTRQSSQRMPRPIPCLSSNARQPPLHDTLVATTCSASRTASLLPTSTEDSMYHAASPDPSVASEPFDSDTSCVPCHLGSHALPLYDIPGEKAVHYISRDTVADLVMGAFDDRIASYVIIDCRFEYEYLAGHIDGAVNINDPHHLYELFMKLITAAKLSARRRNLKRPRMTGEPSSNECERESFDPQQPQHGCPCPEKPIVIIFHCEYSQVRGINAWNLFRALDRNTNSHVWPHLTFPEIFVMAGGYRKFYDEYRHLCVPRGFVSMFHKEYTENQHQESRRSKLWSECRQQKIEREYGGELFRSRRRRAASLAAGVRLPIAEQPSKPMRSALKTISLFSRFDECTAIDTRTNPTEPPQLISRTLSTTRPLDFSSVSSPSRNWNRIASKLTGSPIAECGDLASLSQTDTIPQVEEEDENELSVLRRMQLHQAQECLSIAYSLKSCHSEGHTVTETAPSVNPFKLIFENAVLETFTKARSSGHVRIHPCHNRYTRSLYPSLISPLPHSELSYAMAYAARADPVIAHALIAHRNAQPAASRGEEVGMYESEFLGTSVLRSKIAPLSVSMPRVSDTKVDHDEEQKRSEKDLDTYQEQATRLDQLERHLRLMKKRKQSGMSETTQIADGASDEDENDPHVVAAILTVAREAVQSTALRLRDALEREHNQSVNGFELDTEDLAYDSDRDDAEEVACQRVLDQETNLDPLERKALIKKTVQSVRAQLRTRNACQNYEEVKAALTALADRAHTLTSTQACLLELKQHFKTMGGYRLGCIDIGINIGNPNREVDVEQEFENVITLARNSLRDTGYRSRLLAHAGLWYELTYGPSGIEENEVFLPGSMETSFLTKRSEPTGGLSIAYSDVERNEIAESGESVAIDVMGCDLDASDTRHASEGRLSSQAGDCDLESEMRLIERRSMTEGESLPAANLSDQSILRPTPSAESEMWFGDNVNLSGALSPSCHMASASTPDAQPGQSNLDLPVDLWGGCGCSCHLDLERYMRAIYSLGSGNELERRRNSNFKTLYAKCNVKNLHSSPPSLALQNGLARATHVILSRNMKKVGARLESNTYSCTENKSESFICWRDHCLSYELTSPTTSQYRGSRGRDGSLSMWDEQRDPRGSGSLKSKPLFKDSPGPVQNDTVMRLTRSVSEANFPNPVIPSHGIRLCAKHLPSFCVTCGCVQLNSGSKDKLEIQDSTPQAGLAMQHVQPTQSKDRVTRTKSLYPPGTGPAHTTTSSSSSSSYEPRRSMTLLTHTESYTTTHQDQNLTTQSFRSTLQLSSRTTFPFNFDAALIPDQSAFIQTDQSETEPNNP